MNASLLKEFKNPGSAFRGKPFWAWNGKLEPEELRRQIRIMKRMGLGGFFMHSRVGLDTPYLSREWFACVNTCIDEAKKQGMEAWLYDEDRWPSGAAGGLVTRNPAYRGRWIMVEVLQDLKSSQWGKDVVAVFRATVDGSRATGVQRILSARDKKSVKGGNSFIVFREVVLGCTDWHNGYTYLDTLNHAAVKEFIRVTHEAYRKNVGRHFGKLVPGIFTDEPNFYDHWDPSGSGQTRFPWTRSLPATFRKRYGYDIVEHLPEVFFDVDGNSVSRARYHYMDCVTFLFVDAFSRQIGEWCQKNGIAFTGHVLCEELLSSQTSKVGSAMRFYENMQAPGIDILTQYNREYDTAKGVASVAHQFGRKWRLSETYGCTGWDFPFAGHKAVGDWQAALGINLRCQHLSWYTMEAEAKRDYPAAIFYQSPWWEQYRTVEDYYSRVHVAMTRGEEVRDILVIHPIESTWLQVKLGWNKDKKVYDMDRVLIDLRDTLLGATLDFDYGDEDIIARHGSVASVNGGARLRVARARYKVVVVPPMVTMRASTVKLLRAFAAKGGTVVFAGDPAPYVDALPSKEPEALARKCARAPAKGPDLVSATESGRRVSIVDDKDREIGAALYMLREDAEAYYLFVCNTGHEFVAPAEWAIGDNHHSERVLEFPVVKIRGFGGRNGTPVELDPQNGSAYSAAAVRKGDLWEISTSLPKLGSRLFMVQKKKDAAKLPDRVTLCDVRTIALNQQAWAVQLSEPNVLVLDQPSYVIGDRDELPPKEILRVDSEVHDRLGLRYRGGAMVQPWARKKSPNPKSVDVSLRYEFNVECVPSGSLLLAAERINRFAITVNGTPVDTTCECGWWVDRSLKTVRIDPALLKRGRNEIAMSLRYDEDFPGLEIVYLLGNFGVRVDGANATMTAFPQRLSLGDWVAQGLPFYSGSVTYRCAAKVGLGEGERLFLRAPGYAGVAVRVLVDGKEAGVRGWEPTEVDITDLIGKDESTVGIEVLGHRRNSHGPLHLKDKTPHWVGPGEFKTGGDRWSDDYVLVPCGLLKEPELVVRRLQG
jgi:hypothetical protein